MFKTFLSGTENTYVGELVEVNGYKLKIRRVIAEGGFAFVYMLVFFYCQSD